jgi:hypothetical protein
LVIDAATLSIAADHKTKTYGAADPALTFVASGFQFGDTNSVFTGSVTRAPGENVGTYAIIQGTLSAGSNYNILFTGANLTITPRDLTVTADPNSKVYGDSDPTFTYTHGTLYNGDTNSVFTGSLSRVAGENVDTYVITQGSLSAGINYTILFVSANFTITPRDLTVTADALSKIYGNSDPTLTYTHGALYNGDTNSVFTGSLTRDSGETVGTYTIHQGTLSAGINYNILFTGANFTINPRDLDITANNRTKTYGDVVLFAGTEFTTGMGQVVTGDSIASVTLTSAGTAASATVTTPGPDYDIVPSAATGTGLSNYTIHYHNGTLHVNPKNASVTAASTSKTYGQTVTFAGTEFTTSGFINSDNVTSVTLTSAGAAATATVTAPGPDYPIVPGAAVGSGLGNYNISYVNGNLHVNVKNASVTANGTTKTYGQTVTFAGTEFTTSGFINGDTVMSATLTSAGAASSATVTAPGPDYAIVPSAAVGSGVGNYNISYVNGTLHVDPKNASVTGNNRSKTYGQTVTFTGTEFTISGFINGDTVTSVTLTSAGAPATATVTAPGPDYAIVPTNAVGTGLGNYNISYANGTLHINTAGLTITALPRSKVFGVTYTPDTTPPSLDLNIVGLVNGDLVTNVTLTCPGYPAAALPQPTPYTITPSAAVFSPAGAGGNYTISYMTGQFTIGYGNCTGGTPGHQILPPINPDGSSVWKVGSTVPVKFTVCDANGNPISDPTAVFATGYGSITLINTVRGTVNNVNETTYTDIPDVAFRWSGGQWIFNMATSNLQKNTTYTFRINLKDGSYIEFTAGTK